jgi:predicted nucleotidyltransferase
MGFLRPAAVPPEDQQGVIKEKLAWVLSACAPREVWLFGSLARGEMTEASDVDIALVFDDPENLRACRDALHATPRTPDWPVDLAFFLYDDLYERAKVGGLPMLIVEEGRRLYWRDEA